MKSSVSQSLKSALALCALMGAASQIHAQTVVTVDPNQSFTGFMNVFELPANGSAYDFGSSWGVADLRANYVGTNSLVLLPCTNVWETGDTYWVQGDGVTPNKIMDASFYIQNDSLTNITLTFNGNCISNTLSLSPEPHTGVSYVSTAFIKLFDGSFNLVGSVASNLVTGTPFSISLNTTGATHIQYGLETVGPDASPTTGNTLGQVVIAQAIPAVPIPVPTNNAPTPTRSAGSVLSLYNSSGVYTNHPVERFLAPWSSANESIYTNTVTGRAVLKYSALQYAGVEFYDTNNGDNVGGSVNYSINATPYDTLHLDVWTPNANQLGLQIVSLNPTVGPEVDFLPASGTITSNHWISLDIPLSYFTATNSALDLTDLQQALWIDNQSGGGVTGGIFYFDNIYFYSSVAVSRPTITAVVQGGVAKLSFPTVASSTYTVQYSTNLSTTNWTTLTNVTGTGSTQTVNDPANQAKRFYRLYVH